MVLTRSLPTRFNRVLLLTDFSPHSRAVAGYALQLLRQTLSDVIVAHVLPPTGAKHYEPAPHVKRSQREAAQGEMDAFINESGLTRLRPKIVYDHGPFREAVPALAEAYGVDMIISGTGRRADFEERTIGSVADEIFGVATRPLLTVAPGLEPRTSTLAPARILFVSDLSPTAVIGAECAANLAADCDAELILLHVMSGNDRTEAAIRAHDVSRHLDHMLPERRKQMQLRIVFDFGDPVETILTDAAGLGADLMVMAVHDTEREPSDPRHAHFTVAKPVLARAPCPVLTTRAIAHVGALGGSERSFSQTVPAA